MRITSARLRAAHEQLTQYARALQRNQELAGAAVTGARSGLDGAGRAWDGPLSDRITSVGSAYLDEVARFLPALSSARERVASIAGTAVAYAGELARAEADLQRAIDASLRSHTLDEISEVELDVSRAEARIEGLSVSWRQHAGVVFDGLAAEIAHMRAATSALLGDVTLPSVPASLPPPGSDHHTVIAWWATLSAEERLSAILGAPEAVGALDGLPAWVRDVANRERLADDLARLAAKEGAGTLSPAERRQLANARAVAEVLRSHDDHVDPLTRERTVAQLYIYEPEEFDGDGRVAIAIGDLDTADHIAVCVPGMQSDVSGMSAGEAQNLYDQARFASDDGDSVAVLTWMGYDAPNANEDLLVGDLGGQLGDVAAVGLRSKADAGAERLARDVGGLRALRGDDDEHLTVIGHSYGSTTTAIAADEHGLVGTHDDVVLIGSPGAGRAATAHDFPTGPDHTWVGSSSSDMVTYFGETEGVEPVDRYPRLGNDPAEGRFQAKRFQAENTDRQETGHLEGVEIPAPIDALRDLDQATEPPPGNPDLIPDVRHVVDTVEHVIDTVQQIPGDEKDHVRYYEEGSESLHNIAPIVVREYEEVTPADRRQAPPPPGVDDGQGDRGRWVHDPERPREPVGDLTHEAPVDRHEP